MDMDTSGEHSGLMAETLIVLAGENAWSAARGFRAQSVRDGDLTRARYWRSVSRAVLETYAERLAVTAEVSAMPDTAPAAPEAPAEMPEAAAAPAAPDAAAETPEVAAATPEIATADPDSATGWNNFGRAPIPLRARRNSSLHAMAPMDPAASASVEGNAAEELLVARAA